MGTRIVLTGKEQVELEEFIPASELNPDQVRVRTLYSLISSGTEMILFHRNFAEGSGWDNWLQYPFYPGYAAICEVVEVGSEVTTLTPGQRVALRQGHLSERVVEAVNCIPVPDGIDSKEATWFALAKIASIGARAGGFRLADQILLIGAGPVGQMALRWAVAAGAETVAVLDPISERLEFARRGGATVTLNMPIAGAKESIREAMNGTLPRVVVDCTGNAEVFAAALETVRDRGTAVILGDTGFARQQTLTSDVIGRGLHIVGAHDTHNDEEWNNATVTRLLFKMVQTKRFDLSGLITHTYTPDQCREAYAAAGARQGNTMGILFDWTASAK